MNDLLQEKLTDFDIDQSNWMRKIKKGNQSRPIIIKFVRYNIRNSVFKSKTKLRDTAVNITKSLTQKRMQMLTSARSKVLFKNVSTHDGKSLVKSDGNNIKVYYN